ncbi:putative addiction module antidote protein [Comamonas serinivorans]|uniref:Putative addiction module antidote protein n=1 Tax=Comamonas serinivorans TaxID=1082851 RepID=A0A1Y0EMB0_9BURK|nr:putative addiction module antidote protein [Comamonas serinivorans]
MVKTKPFDAAEFLTNDAEMLAYIQAALEDGDPLLVAAALGDVARARGMADLARKTGLSRESLYKGLSGESAPTTTTFFKVVEAFGLRLDIRAKDSSPPRKPFTRKTVQAKPKKTTLRPHSRTVGAHA